MKNHLKRNFYFQIPQKSIFGFKILNCLQSSIFAYFILLLILSLNPFFGCTFNQYLFGYLFNIVASVSLIILILNLFIKRKELKRNFFILLNTPLIIFMPILILYLIKNVINLFILIRNF